jgi:hypothetical protein
MCSQGQRCPPDGAESAQNASPPKRTNPPICTLTATRHPTGGGIQIWSFCRADDPARGEPLLAWLSTSGSAGHVTCARSGLLGGTGFGGRGGRQFAVGDDVDVDAEGTRFMDDPS